MKMFPLFVDIEGKRIVMVGGGRKLSEKLEKILPYGAQIELYTEDPILATEGITIRRGLPDRKDLIPPPVFVLVAGAGEMETERICGLCRAMGIPVNAADAPKECTFFFPALVTRGNMTVAVSTSGQSPAVASVLRTKIEDQVPSGIEEILDWAQALRGTLQGMNDGGERKKILKRAVAYAIEKGRPLTELELEEASRSSSGESDD